MDDKKIISLDEYNENYKKEQEEIQREEILSSPITNIKCQKCEDIYRENSVSYRLGKGRIKILQCPTCFDVDEIPCFEDAIDEQNITHIPFWKKIINKFIKN